MVQKQYEVTALSGAQKVAITEVSKANENAKTHIFKYDVNASNGCLIPVIQQGLPSVEELQTGAKYCAAKEHICGISA